MSEYILPSHKRTEPCFFVIDLKTENTLHTSLLKKPIDTKLLTLLILNNFSLLQKLKCNDILVKKVLVLSTAQLNTTKILYADSLHLRHLQWRVFSADKPQTLYFIVSNIPLVQAQTYPVRFINGLLATHCRHYHPRRPTTQGQYMFLAIHLEPLTLPKVGLVGWCTFTAIYCS